MVKRINYTVLLIAALITLNACESKEKTISASDSAIVVAPNTDSIQAAEASKMALTQLDFLEDSFDFGKIAEGIKVNHEFKFKNTGSNPLVLQDARASCGCTIPEYTKDTIAPGAEGTMKVIYDSEGKNGKINKTVTVTANTDPATTVIKISAFVLEKKEGPYNKQ